MGAQSLSMTLKLASNVEIVETIKFTIWLKQEGNFTSFENVFKIQSVKKFSAYLQESKV